jgi:predicted nucleic acid-binding protein
LRSRRSVWCEIRPDPPADPTLAFLDSGERAAIPLAVLARVDRLLIDDLAGRAEARRRKLVVTGVLAEAHLAGLLDFEPSIAKLRETNFYISDEVIMRVRQQLASAGSKP